jgi:tRNA pseudouridine55 synthase
MAYGLLNIFKPEGPTSHDIVAAVRRGTGEKRIGHAGTLDPLAEGVLVLALGKATRLIEYLSSARKEYHAEITLGITTDTYDVQGEVTARYDTPPYPDQAKLDSALAKFRGPILQRPPAYSAIKVSGKPAYARARAGETLELPAREVTIDEIGIAKYSYPLLEITVACSAGTYIRSLAHDLGQMLGCGAALSMLRRTASGDFHEDQSVRWDALTGAFAAATWEQYLIPVERGVASMPAVTLDDNELIDILHGRPIRATGSVSGLCSAYSPSGELVAILSDGSDARLWYPHKVLSSPAGRGEQSSE